MSAQHVWSLTTWDEYRLHSLALVPGLEGKALDQKQELEEQLDLQRSKWAEKPEKSLEEEWSKRVTSMMVLNKTWEDITPQQFVVCVNMLGKDVADYLTLLSVRIDDSVWKTIGVKSKDTDDDGTQTNNHFEIPECMRWLQQARYDQAETLQILSADFPKQSDMKNVDYIKWGRTTARCYLARKPQVKMSVHWTTAKKLIKPNTIDDQVRIIQALFYCGMDSECFNTVISKCILKNAWDSVKKSHWLILVLDFTFLVLLACNSGCMIYYEKAPPLWLIRLTQVFVIRAFVNTLIMLFSHVLTLNFIDGLYAVITKWNIAMMIVEAFNAYYLGEMLFLSDGLQADQECNPREHGLNQKCALVLHPVKFAIAIGLKWIHFIFALLNLEGLGNSVLPAFKAVTGTDAMAFMVFLMIVVFGTVQTYWALPIAEHLPKHGRSVFALVFMKIFRLELLGDFDISELEGEDPIIKGDWDGNKLKGKIVEATESPLFHDAIMIIVLFASVVVTVLSMNVAIGVVSTAYSQNKANSNQLYCHFQAGYVFKLLLRRAAFVKVFPIFSKCWLCSHAEPDKKEGYFIGFDERWFMDSKDLDEEFESLQETIESNRHKLDSIENLLESKGDQGRKRQQKYRKRR